MLVIDLEIITDGRTAKVKNQWSSSTINFRRKWIAAV